jgi:hypothetical protein
MQRLLYVDNAQRASRLQPLVLLVRTLRLSRESVGLNFWLFRWRVYPWNLSVVFPHRALLWSNEPIGV